MLYIQHNQLTTLSEGLHNTSVTSYYIYNSVVSAWRPSPFESLVL
jgi:hypothetical protein